MTDIGCGLNPLLYFYATQDDTTEYLAYDIDHEEVNFLNNSFKLLGLKNYKAETKNALTDDFSKSDIAWLLKLVSPLELQKKNATIDLINRIKSKYIIISYTTKTISGKDKRMKDFYSTKFESLAAHNNFKYTRIDFDSELVYIVEK
jgi:16S rRNA (guanine(1405)-N(7))-methyltransferase